MASYIKADTHISIVFDNGEAVTIYHSQPGFESVCDAIKLNDWDYAYQLAFPVNELKQKTEHLSDRVSVEYGIVTLDGIPIHNTLTDRMLQMVDDGFDISPMSWFLENLMDNPSNRAVTELYSFMEHSSLPITEDGYFLAYKRVGGDFKDMYTHTIDNSPGAIVEMPRNQVNEDKDQTCSYGLHFCSRDYLPYYGNCSDSKVVMIKINPRDVVSIPSDYNNAKGRCCKYTVVREMDYDEVGIQNREYMPKEELETVSVYVEPTTESNASSEVETYSDLDLSQVEDFDDTIEENTTDRVVGRYLPGVEGRPIGIYDSPIQAQAFTGVDASSIRKVCDGIQNVAGGYSWRWIYTN